MLIYAIMYEEKNWDVCVKIDVVTNEHFGYYIREYDPEFDAVCRFDRIE